MLRNLKPRIYQETILGTAVNHNTLVVLPTGMGKTAIAVMLAAQRLKQYPDSKILVLAPTRPLVDQHRRTFLQLLEIAEDELVVLTGMIRPEKRKQLADKAKIIFSTPQGLENDAINKNIMLKDYSLVVFDEAHRAVGEYSYNYIAAHYVKQADYTRILGLTASPGSDKETIMEVLQNLHIEKVEIRTENDPDVKEYVQEMDIKWVKVELPELYLKARNYLSACYDSKIRGLKDKGVLYKNITTVNKTTLLGLQGGLQAKIAQGEKDYDLMKAMSIAAEALKVQHALELIETQGARALMEYMNKLEEQAISTRVKAVQNLVNDLNFRSARIIAEKLLREEVEHPKMEKLLQIIREEKDAEKIIIFNQYRDQADSIKKKLDAIGIKSKIFFGQQKRKTKGLSQKQQKEIIQEFTNKQFQCLIATSVAEEGLDIPKVDLVIFYEAIPSAIRTIQRRGRTGRLEKGKVYVLIAKGTRDESYRWVAQSKERRMHRELKSIQKDLNIPLQEIKTLDEYNKVIIHTDYREKNSALMKELVEMGADVRLQRLEVGDYVLSERVGVEIKKVPDFVDSILDGRLTHQLRDMKQYAQPILIVEGTENIYQMRRVHPNAIRGMISTILVGYGIPIVQTENSRETARLMHMIARQEQLDEKKYQFHKSKPISLREQQEHLVATIPGIGPALAKPLLRKFSNPLSIFNANEDALQEVELVGPKKAKNIRRLMREPYK